MTYLEHKISKLPVEYFASYNFTVTNIYNILSLKKLNRNLYDQNMVGLDCLIA